MNVCASEGYQCVCSEECNRVTVNPAQENTRSEGVEVIGIERNLLATLEIMGNLW